MLKLVERMVRSFCVGVSASTTHIWTTLSGTGADDVCVMTQKNVHDPGTHQGVLCSLLQPHSGFLSPRQGSSSSFVIRTPEIRYVNYISVMIMELPNLYNYCLSKI